LNLCSLLIKNLDTMSLNQIEELDKGQLAYRDTDGNLIILPMNDQGIREAFIARLTQEFVEDRSADELLERFKQACQDASNGNTKSIEELKNQSLSKQNSQGDQHD